MRQSNTYVLLYTLATTVLCAGVLAFASSQLKDRQEANIALEKKKNILNTVIDLQEGEDISLIYATRIRSFVVNYQGNRVPDIIPESIHMALEYKKNPQDRLLPIYEFLYSDSAVVKNVIIPMYGKGLWNNIWGYVALEADVNTLKGVVFDHIGETPGLGSRITTKEVQNRFSKKQIFREDQLVSVKIQKGEGNDYSNNPHQVDGISSATLTANGVNDMLIDYFTCYEQYLRKNYRSK